MDGWTTRSGRGPSPTKICQIIQKMTWVGIPLSEIRNSFEKISKFISQALNLPKLISRKI